MAGAAGSQPGHRWAGGGAPPSRLRVASESPLGWSPMQPIRSSAAKQADLIDALLGHQGRRGPRRHHLGRLLVVVGHLQEAGLLQHTGDQLQADR